MPFQEGTVGLCLYQCLWIVDSAVAAYLGRTHAMNTDAYYSAPCVVELCMQVYEMYVLCQLGLGNAFYGTLFLFDLSCTHMFA